MRRRELRGEEGASAVEYGLLVAGIAAIVILLVFALGGFVKEAFQGTCDQVDAAYAPTASTTCGS
jgi:pilus assembly protein Flp/PilA